LIKKRTSSEHLLPCLLTAFPTSQSRGGLAKVQRELSDYSLVQDLLRVRAVVRAAIGQVDHQIQLARHGMPFDQARAPLTNKLLGFAAAFQDIHDRAMARQAKLREATGMPEVIVATAGDRKQWQ
jgi:hypothetical protein